jgi:beta-glucanase (GH16 family)
MVKNVKYIGGICLLAAMLTGCNEYLDVNIDENGTNINSEADDGKTKIYVKVSGVEQTLDFENKEWPNGQPGTSVYCPSNVLVDDNKVEIKLSSTGCDFTKDKLSGEINTKDGQLYGTYSANILPNKLKGTISTMYLNSDIANENDFIGFILQPNGQITFKYSVVGNNLLKTITPDFDIFDDNHNYQIVWGKDNVSWFIDENKVYEVNSEKAYIPDFPLKLFFNNRFCNDYEKDWCGTINTFPSVLDDEIICKINNISIKK